MMLPASWRLISQSRHMSGKFAVGTALLDFGKEFLGGLYWGTARLAIAWVRKLLIRWEITRRWSW